MKTKVWPSGSVSVMEYVIVVATSKMVENIVENEEVIYIVNDLLKLKL